jgi:KDO2-lipid IV(A) lauroyltransferase
MEAGTVLPFAFRFIGRLPLRWLHGCGVIVGWLIYWFSPRYAKRMSSNLALSGICTDADSYRKLLRSAIVHNGKALMELPAVWFSDDDEVGRLVLDCRGWELVESLRREDRKIIFLSPHMGCFEIAARYVAAHLPLTVMYRPQKAGWLDALMESGRSKKQLQLAPTSLKGVRMLYRALRRGDSIGLLPDHAPGLGEGIWAEFFGKPAFTMTLPRKLQHASGAALVMTFAERLPAGKGFRLHFEHVPADGFDEVRLNQAIENLVRRYPQQYYWNYNRYKKMSLRRQRRALESRRAKLPQS